MLNKRSIVILTQQISNYHAARYIAAEPSFGQFTIISTMNDADFPEFLSSGADKHRIVRLFEGKDNYHAAVNRGGIWRDIHSTLDKLQPKLVAVAGWSFPESLSAIAWAKANGARIVMMSASQERDGARNYFREAIKSRIVSACDAALVGGRHQREYVARLGIPRDRVFLGYDSVDNNHFSRAADLARANANGLRSQYGLPNHFILAVARFIPKKNLEQLVIAFARALQVTPTSHHLVILGDGPGRKALQAAIASAGINDRVLLAGFKDYQTLPIFYGLADAFVHVALAEQWGLVINEAAAAGLPLVVSRNCGAADELIPSASNGILVDPADIEDMATALSHIMGLSEESREAMGLASRRVVAEWGTERYADGLHKASEAALTGPLRKLSMVDRLLMMMLSKFYFNAVS